MSYSIAGTNITVGRAPVPLDLFEGDTMIDPKWFVMGVALGAFALMASYDVRLGMAAGVLLSLGVLIYLFVRIKLSIEPGEVGSNRARIARRLSLLSRNRREAQRSEEDALAARRKSS